MLPTTRDLLEKSFYLYKNNKGTLLKYTSFFGLILIATFFVRVFLSLSLLQKTNISGSSNNAVLTLPSYSEMILPAVILFGMYLLSLWATLTLIHVIAKIYTKETLHTVMQEFKTTTKFIFPAFWAVILMALSIIGGFTLLVIPGIVFSVWFVFSVYAVLLDKKRGVQALQLSKTLVTGQWWEILWLITSTTFLIFSTSVLFKIVVRFLFTLIGQVSGNPPTLISILDIVGPLLMTLFGLCIAPLSAAVPTILYIELKKNKNL